MKLVAYDPWRTFGDINSELDRLFDRRRHRVNTDLSEALSSEWMPSVDIKEEEQRFVLYADIPGVDPKDIEVTTEKGTLTIKGERTAEKKEEGQRYTRRERTHGTFVRRFTLPDSADAGKVKAHGRNGVLEIVVPKREETQPRRIPIAA